MSGGTVLKLPGKNYKISEVREGDPVAPYAGMGITTVFSTRLLGFEDVEGITLEDVMSDLGKPATWLIWQLVKIRDQYSNICLFKVLDNKEKQKAIIGFKELLKHNLVLRLGRQKYMLNPRAVTPVPDKYMEVQTNWDTIKGGSNE